MGYAPRLMARVFCACALVCSPCIVCACVFVIGSERGLCGANPWVLTLMRVRVVVLSYNPRVVNRRNLNHMQIPSLGICPKIQEYSLGRIRSKHPRVNQWIFQAFFALSAWCVFFTLNRSLYSSISSTPCVRADS